MFLNHLKKSLRNFGVDQEISKRQRTTKDEYDATYHDHRVANDGWDFRQRNIAVNEYFDHDNVQRGQRGRLWYCENARVDASEHDER